MADERDEKDEPKIRIVDNRMLSDDERRGILTPAGGFGAQNQNQDQDESSTPPKLEIIGGYASSGGGAPVDDEIEADTLMADPSDFEGDMTDLSDAPEMSDEEAQQMRDDLEVEQFAQIEAQLGRPLTESEKTAVRQQMEQQARAIASMEVAPVVVQTLLPLVETMPRYASVHLGLTPNPYTRLIARNDAQARAAIDTFAAAFEMIKESLDAQSRRECARVLNDLRVNYANITGTQPSGPGRIIH